LGYRILFSLVAVLMVGGSLLPWDDGSIALPPDGSGDYQHDLGYRFLGIVLAAVLLTWVFRARMDLHQDDIVARYMLSSRRISLSDITSVTSGREGLSIETRGGAAYGSPMFIGQKAPLASWLGRRTQADEIAEAIMNARP
jgi:hypothetical protein